MKKTAALAFCGLLGGVALSQAPQATPPPNAMPVAQVVGRVQINTGFVVDLFGYFTAAEGLDFALFNGEPGEKTAVLTYKAERVGVRAFLNGTLLQGLEKPASGTSTLLTVYYAPAPANRDWNDRDTFAQGMPVARFRSRNAAVAVYPGSYVATSGLTLESSEDFVADGKTYNLRNQANGLSLSLNGPAPAIDTVVAQVLRDGRVQIPQAGTGWAASSN